MSLAIGAAGERLPAWSLFAAVLSAAGLPIYIYAPKFYAESYGVSLASLGAVLFSLRLLDVVQDPLLGWVAERLQRGRALAASLVAGLLALSMLGLFAVAPPLPPLWWFALTLTGLFSAFSFLTIAFYASGVTRAGADGQLRLAAWRETGALLGVCIAAVAPTLLIDVTAAPFATFAWGFAAVALLAALAMWPEWPGRAAAPAGEFGTILRDPLARRILLLAFVNAAPVAVTSTLFLFFVESRLEAAGWEGPLLVIFFLAAALSAAGWSRAASRFGTGRTLLAAMILSILSFGWAASLAAGDAVPFLVICLLSGAATGADLTLLPAAFARRMAEVSPRAGQGFGLWSLVNKATLAVAAAALLPLLQAAGFVPGAAGSPKAALSLLSVLYAGVPVGLKLVALALLAVTPLDR